MNKDIKIDFKDIKNSPYTILAVLAIVAVALIAVTVWLLSSINNTKAEIIEVRKLLQDNVQNVAFLEELRVKSEEAEAKLEYYDGVLPEKLDDVHILEEELAKEISSFGLEVTALDETVQNGSATVETVFSFTASGSYSDFMCYLQYVSGKTDIHRVDSFVLSEGENGKYSATISIAVLSQEGAEGAPSPLEEAVDEVVNTATDDTAA